MIGYASDSAPATKATIFVLYYHYYHCYYVLYGRPDSPSVRTLCYRISLYSASARCDMKHILYRTQNCLMPLCVLQCVCAVRSWRNQASDKMSTGSTDWLFVLRPASTMTTIDIITAIYSFPAYSTSSAEKTTMKTSFVLSESRESEWYSRGDRHTVPGDQAKIKKWIPYFFRRRTHHGAHRRIRWHLTMFRSCVMLPGHWKQFRKYL